MATRYGKYDQGTMKDNYDVEKRRQAYERNKQREANESESNIQNQMRRNSYQKQRQAREASNEAKIRKQMRQNSAPARKTKSKQSQKSMLDTITDSVSRDTSNYYNPTASGSGRGGKMDREWKNHKWSTRERNDNGKWIYDYDKSTTTSGGHKIADPTESNAKAVDELLEDAGNEVMKLLSSGGDLLSSGGNSGISHLFTDAKRFIDAIDTGTTSNKSTSKKKKKYAEPDENGYYPV